MDSCSSKALGAAHRHIARTQEGQYRTLKPPSVHTPSLNHDCFLILRSVFGALVHPQPVCWERRVAPPHYTQRAQSFVQGQPHVTEQREGTWSSGTSLSQLEMLIIMAIERSGEGMIIFSTSFLPCSPKVWAVEGADVLPVTTAIPCQIWVKVLTQRLLHRSFVCSSRTWKVTSKWWKLVNTKIWTVWWESLVLQVIDDVSSVFI